MDLMKKLKDQGWYLTEDGLKKLQTGNNNTDDVRKVIEAALNIDFREIGGGALPTKRDEPTLSGNIVLQIQRVRNISAPKSNEESKAAPRFLQLDLSDGQTAIQALELEPVSSLNLNIAPGTKIHFRTGRLQLMQGFIVLRSAEIQVLGGRVEALYDKWDLARTMQKYTRSGRRIVGTGSSAPPPWVAFGKKTGDRDAAISDRNFKSLVALQDKDKEPKENDEFNAMRSEAIAVANKAGNKKVFGGGGQNLVDHNVKKILDKGYSEEDAKYALRSTNNNLERALYNLKRRSERKSGYEDVSNREGASTSGRQFGGRRGLSSKDEPEASKPSGNYSLFDFLTNKLPVSETQPVTTPTQTTTNAQKDNYVNPFRQQTKSVKPDSANDRTKFENNISTSFAANRSSSSRGSVTNGRGRGDRAPRSGNTEPTTRSDDNKADTKRNITQRKPTKEINTNMDKRRDDIGDNSRRKEAPYRSKSGYENKRENERHGSYNQRSENSGSFNQRSENSGNDNRATGTNRNTVPPSNVSTHSKHNEDHSKNMEKLIENTSNMKLTTKPEDNKGRKQKPFQQKRQSQDYHSMSTSTHHGQSSQAQKFHSQQPQQHASSSTSSAQQQQTTSNASNQNANGYSYDPTKIIGFQSKETNEFAMSLLKSQGVGVPAGTAAPPTQFQQKSAANSTSNFLSMGTHYATPNFVVPAQQPALHSPQGFSMNPGNGWMWKIGDLCLAKYWDDGQYYESEITAISDKTCVVFFLGYGNHEEVLKSDCLPITDGNHMPINSLNANQAQVPASGNVYPRRSGGGSSQRYRGERQMYVPPPKRDI